MIDTTQELEFVLGFMGMGLCLGMLFGALLAVKRKAPSNHNPHILSVAAFNIAQSLRLSPHEWKLSDHGCNVLQHKKSNLDLWVGNGIKRFGGYNQTPMEFSEHEKKVLWQRYRDWCDWNITEQLRKSQATCETPEENNAHMTCQHNSFAAEVDVNRLEDTDDKRMPKGGTLSAAEIAAFFRASSICGPAKKE